MWTSLIWLVAAQAILLVVGQIVTLLSAYLKAELNRQLSLNIQTSIYQKVNSISGIAPFENPQLHNTIRLANQGAQHGLEQSLWLLTSLLQSGVTLVSFITVLLAFSPLLASLVVVAALPQLAVQLKLGRQHVRLMANLTPDERRKFYYDFLLFHEKAAKEMRLLNMGAYFINKVSQLYKNIHKAERHQQQQELCGEASLGTSSSLVASGAFLAEMLAAFNGSLSLSDVTLYISAVRSAQDGTYGSLSLLGSQLRDYPSEPCEAEKPYLVAIFNSMRPASLPISQFPQLFPAGASNWVD